MNSTHSQCSTGNNIGFEIIADVDALSGGVTSPSACFTKNAVRRLPQAHIFRIDHYGKVFKQSGALQFSDLLLARPIGNYSKAFSRQILQARLGVLKRASQGFIFENKYPVAPIGLVVAHFGSGEYISHARPPLLPKRNFTSAPAVKVFVEDLFPSCRIFIA